MKIRLKVKNIIDPETNVCLRNVTFSLVLALVFFLPVAAVAQQWIPLGPEGGDVRSLANDPFNAETIYLGTSSGQLFVSSDGGGTWARLAQLGSSNEMVLDNIMLDPRKAGRIYVAAWDVEHPGGDFFISENFGRTWRTVPELHGKSIRAMAMAGSDPRIWVLGALDGIYRSNDNGATWERISPEGHAELKNVESIAIDPYDPETIYAGTWHLPWKTSDGGKTWATVKNGIIDDSDVFSIIIDKTFPTVIYASACSGIYKSNDAGKLFKKVQGIPYSARRTRVLMQDPSNPNVVYAGTTEGLWKSQDSGATWELHGPASLVVNDILIDPRDSNRVLLATDRSGVLASNNGAETLTASNRGFSHRQVGALLVDTERPGVLYAGLVNDKEFGGVLRSENNGADWEPMNNGLGGKDVFVLRQTASGLIAGTNKGIAVYSPEAGSWKTAFMAAPGGETSVKGKGRGTRMAEYPRVYDVERATGENADGENTSKRKNRDKWYAATSAGMFESRDDGQSWRSRTLLDTREIVGLSWSPALMVAASQGDVFFSSDQGKNWNVAILPEDLSKITGITIGEDSVIWVAAREGAFFSRDGGQKWERSRGLPANDLLSIEFDAESHRLLVTSRVSTDGFESADNGRSWRRLPSVWPLRRMQVAGKRVWATTAFDGIVVQPEPPAAAVTATSGTLQ